MSSAAITLVVILFLLVSITGFYLYTSDFVDIKNTHKSNNETSTFKSDIKKQDDYKIAFMANRCSDYLECRTMTLIISNSQYYVYSDKKDYHIQQLQIDNRVSLLIYTKQGESMKQVLLYGELEVVNETKNLVLYKLKIDHRKIAITVDTSESRTTSYSYDGSDQKEFTTNFNELNALIANLNI